MRFPCQTVRFNLLVTGFLIVFLFCFSLHAQTQTIETQIQALENRIQLGADSLYLQLGELYLENEEWSKADDSFTKYIEKVKKHPAAYVGKGRSKLGKGKSAFIPVEAIKKLFGIDNYSKAHKEFDHAIKLDPNYIDGYYWLSLNYLARGGKKNYGQAATCIQTVLQRNPLFRDADFVLGVVYQHLKKFKAAETTFKEVISKQRSVAKSSIRLSEVLLEQGKSVEAIVYFYDGVSQLKDPKIIDEIYSQIEFLMTKDEKQEYKKLAMNQRGDLFRRFWKGKDPTPTTQKNERYEVHYERVKIALENYPDIIPPHYDDRGKVYVKYGQPDDRYISKIYMDGIKQNESWTYEESVRPGLTFDFVRKGNIYRQAISLLEAAPAGVSPANARTYASELYYDRISLSESYARIFATPDFTSALNDFQADRGDAQAYAPPENYKFELPGRKIEFIYTASRFRAREEDKILTEFYFAIPLNQLSYKTLADQSLNGTLIYNMMIQDTAYHTIDQKTGRIPISARSQDELLGRVFVHQENFTLDPGQYRFSVRVENPEGDARGLYTNAISTQSYKGDHVKLSDIQLSSKVEASDPNNQRFVKNDLHVMPYPYHVLRLDQLIYIYFEGYNLSFNENGLNDYTISYRINMVKTKRGFLSKTIGSVGRLFGGRSKGRVGSSYNRKGRDRAIIEYLSIDLSRMKPGEAEIVLTLTDNITGKTDKKSVSLQLVETPKK